MSAMAIAIIQQVGGNCASLLILLDVFLMRTNRGSWLLTSESFALVNAAHASV
jgi:hypothetical protein